jgi:F-type H+-transporting ATPase subunit b
MELNWIRIVAQLLNLAFLVYLLRRFLFGPITTIMAERERRIADGLNRGRQLAAEGEALAVEYRRRLEDFEGERRGLLQEAKREAEGQRHALLARARGESEAAHRHFHESLEQEKASVLLLLQEELISHACGLAHRVLAELADSSLEELALDALVKRLGSAEGKEAALIKAGLETDPLIVVTTGRPLTAETQHRVGAAIREACRPHLPTLDFQVSGELVFGAAIQTSAASLEWNAASYLRQLEDDSRHELLQHEATGQAHA